MIFYSSRNLHQNICYGYSLESPQQGDSNEYPQLRPQHMFYLFLCRVANKPSIGPVLPPHLQEKHKTYDESEESDHVQNVAGPVLPPHLTQISESLSSSRTFKGKKESKKVYGPVIPGNEDVTDDNSDDDDDGLVGPSVFMQAKGEEGSALEDFESRAQKMRDRLTGKVSLLNRRPVIKGIKREYRKIP